MEIEQDSRRVSYKSFMDLWTRLLDSKFIKVRNIVSSFVLYNSNQMIGCTQSHEINSKFKVYILFTR